LKIAGYPGRVYYGRIDRQQKSITLSLDFSALYEAAEVQTMEKAAIDYATRLLATRFDAFGEDMAAYFDPSVADGRAHETHVSDDIQCATSYGFTSSYLLSRSGFQRGTSERSFVTFGCKEVL